MFHLINTFIVLHNTYVSQDSSYLLYKNNKYSFQWSRKYSMPVNFLTKLTSQHHRGDSSYGVSVQ